MPIPPHISRLAAADYRFEHWEHAHSREFAGTLAAAGPLRTLRDYERALERLRPFRTKPISKGQEMRLLHIEGKSLFEQEQVTEASGRFEEALSIAHDLHASADIVQLASEVATTSYFRTKFSKAVSFARLGLDLHRSIPALRRAKPSPHVVELHHRIGVCQLLLGDYTPAAYHLTTASKLVRRLPADTGAARQSAMITWEMAAMNRFMGRLALARDLGEQALAMLQAQGESRPAARMAVELANCHLDMLEPSLGFRLEVNRDVILQRVNQYLRYAGPTLQECHDKPGTNLVNLATARWQWHTKQETQSLRTLYSVAEYGDQHRDKVVQGKLYTVLGLHAATAGAMDEASDFYKQAIGVLEEAESTAEATPARRALLRAQEMYDR